MISLDSLKIFVRVDACFEDDNLQDQIDVGIELICNTIHRKIYANESDIPTDDSTGMVITKAIAQAVMLYIRFIRDAQDTQEKCTMMAGFPDSAYRLIIGYRIFGV